MPSLPSWTTSTASPDSPRPRWMLAARRRSSSINKILMTSSIRTAPKRYLKGVLGWLQLRCSDLGPGPAERAKNLRRCPLLKTPKTIGLLALPVVLAAAVITASAASAKAPAHQAAATAPTAAQTPAPDVEPAEAAQPAETETETNDAAGGHADHPE